MGERCLIIANPISGMGLGRRQAPRLAAALREQGRRVELVWTDAPGTARQAAERADPSDVALILCVGGDGTLNEIVNGLADKHIPVSILPTGTGNVLAKEYGMPYGVGRAADMIARGRTVTLDVGLIAGRRFVLFAGAGFDGAVTRALGRSRVGRINMLDYLGPALRALATYDFPEMELAVDGASAGVGTCVLVANVHSYGGPFAIVEEADPTDGLLDVCLLRGRTRRDLARYVWGGFRRRLLDYPDVTHARGTTVELRSETGVPIQVDGDFMGMTPAQIELLPARLPVVVP